MRYPIEVLAGGLDIPVTDASSFVKIYHSVISQAVRQAVTGAKVDADAKAPVTLGGAVTISAVPNGFKVTGIEVPAGATSKPPGEIIERQLSFRVGQPTQVSGTLDASGKDRFIFYAVKGAYLDIRLRRRTWPQCARTPARSGKRQGRRRLRRRRHPRLDLDGSARKETIESKSSVNPIPARRRSSTRWR